MQPILEVYRIENENGKGPFYSLSNSYIPEDILKPMFHGLNAPEDDFQDLDWRTHPFPKFCEEKLKTKHFQCFFAFPSYEVFKNFVGDRENEIAEYVTTYKTSNYVVSKSGLQVIFTK